MLKPSLIDLDTAAAGEDIDPDDTTRAQSVLDTVSALARHEARQDWVDDLGALTEVPDIVQVIVAQAWRRAWAVPIGVQAEAIAVSSVTWDRESRAGAYLTDDEKRILRTFRSKNVGLRTIRTTRRLNDFESDISYPVIGTDGTVLRPIYDDVDLAAINGDL